MNTAVLCAGPSLPEVWAESRFDQYALVVAVNTAAWLFRCHWMAATDDDVLRPVLDGKNPRTGAAIPRPGGFLVPAAWVRHITRLPAWAFVRTRPLHRTLQPTIANAGQPRFPYTFPNALDFALHESTEGVDCFGVDYALGKLDAAGKWSDAGEGRFALEAEDVREVIAMHRKPVRFFGRATADTVAYFRGERPDYVRRDAPVAGYPKKSRMRTL